LRYDELTRLKELRDAQEYAMVCQDMLNRAEDTLAEIRKRRALLIKRLYVDYKLVRTDREVDDLLNSAAAWEEVGGTQFRGMTYEQGVGMGVKWALGLIEEHPIQEDPPPEDGE
jgi:hypothetical protein